MYTNDTILTPRGRRHEVTRQKILDAARNIIVKNGLESLSMRGLADSIDYSPSAIYKYFDSKEKILIAIRDEGWVLANAMMATAAAVPDLDPPQRLTKSGKMFLKFAETYPEHYQLMFNTPDLPAGGPTEILSAPGFQALINTVVEGVEQGYFKLPEGYTPALMAFHLWISSHGMAMLKKTLMRNNRQEFDTLCDLLIDLFVDAMTIKSSGSS
jgi:AcrR family transcriptional regulator